jgi:hypothetical protein
LFIEARQDKVVSVQDMNPLALGALDAGVEGGDGSLVGGVAVKGDAALAHLANHGLRVVLGRAIVDDFDLHD